MVSRALHTQICEMLGCKYPIIQTGMGWVSTPELVAATCNAGGFGILATATIAPGDVDAAIRKVKSLTDQPFGVNFLMEAPGAEIIVDAILRHRCRVASYSRSPNPAFIKRFKEAGVLCVPTCGQARHAQKAVQLGADIVIVQGGEGGGHTGSVPSTVLISQVVDLVKVPVVAAGGFKDGRGLVAALAFGAQGIAMGTRFLLTKESPVPMATLKRYLAASPTDIQITTEVDGMPQRVIMNELVSKLETSNSLLLLWRAFQSALAYRKLSGVGIVALLRSALSMRRSEKLTNSQMLMAANAPILVKKAMVDGDPVEGVLPGGQIAGAIDEIPSCAELIARIVGEAERTLKHLTE